MSWTWKRGPSRRSAGRVVKEEDLSYPDLRLVFSTLQRDRLVPPSPVLADPRREKMVATFEGLLGSTTFVKQVSTLMRLLEEGLETAVDVEFACEGRNLYVLQCRAQSYAATRRRRSFPRTSRSRRFSSGAAGTSATGRFLISAMWCTWIRSLMPAWKSLAELKAVGDSGGPAQPIAAAPRFILMGSRALGQRAETSNWGSASPTPISTTRPCSWRSRTGRPAHSPDLSFGTHFFQDLVESSIRYLPSTGRGRGHVERAAAGWRRPTILPPSLRPSRVWGGRGAGGWTWPKSQVGGGCRWL